MFASLKYVFTENFQNLYRIYCIAKYELLADMRDSKFGLFWNFASPAIQVLTYWLIFGIAWNRKADRQYPLSAVACGRLCCLVVYPALYPKRLQRYFFQNRRHHQNEISGEHPSRDHLCKGIF